MLCLPTHGLEAIIQPGGHAVKQIPQHLLGHRFQLRQHSFWYSTKVLHPERSPCPEYSPKVLNGAQIWGVRGPILHELDVAAPLLIVCSHCLLSRLLVTGLIVLLQHPPTRPDKSSPSGKNVSPTTDMYSAAVMFLLAWPFLLRNLLLC